MIRSSAQRSSDDAGKKAIGVVRIALNNAPIESGLGVESKAAFDAARGMARQRFAMHEALPALEEAASGGAPDKFVKQFILNEDASRVTTLANLLKKTDPAAFQEAKNQVGAYLQRAAFGENVVGDKAFNPEAYAKALRTIGPSRLSAFFSGTEQAELTAAKVVGATINSHPAVAAVNTSNTAGAMGNFMRGTGTFLRNVPGIKGAADAAALAKATVDVRSALSGHAAERAPALTPEMRRQLSYLLTAGSTAAGMTAAPDF